MIFSLIYRENKAILYNYWLNRYFNYEEIINRINRMVEEILKHNQLIDHKEAIKVLKKDNSNTLKIFAIGDLKRYLSIKW